MDERRRIRNASCKTPLFKIVACPVFVVYDLIDDIRGLERQIRGYNNLLDSKYGQIRDVMTLFYRQHYYFYNPRCKGILIIVSTRLRKLKKSTRMELKLSHFTAYVPLYIVIMKLII